MARKETLKQLFQPIRRLDITFKFNDPDIVDAATTLTLTAEKELPAGAHVLAIKIKTTEGFTGDTTATMQVGKAGALDDYSGAAKDVLAAGDDYGQPATEGEALITAATAPVITVTGGADATSISAGRATVSIYYLDLNSKTF